MKSPVPTINSVWIGPRLGQVHAACLRSFIRHGHRVVLHVYDEPEDTPPGVELSDAERLLPRSGIFRNRRTGSLAPFSDLLRYEILRLGLGMYVDCDVYCLKPFWNADYVMAEEEQAGGYINNAVLRLPADCPVLAELCKLKDRTSNIFPWFTARQKVRYTLERIMNRTSHPLEFIPRSTLGPIALTYYVGKHGLSHRVLPCEVFYPIGWKQVSCFLDPDFPVESAIGDRTFGLHLFHESLPGLLDQPIPDGCILDRVIHGRL